MERLRYSDRVMLAEEGSLGPLSYDEVPEKLGEALASIYEYAASRPVVGPYFRERASAACEQHFGQRFYTHVSSSSTVPAFFRHRYRQVPDLLDAVEIVAEEASRTWTFTNSDGSTTTLAADDEVEARVNAAFVRHRFGYRLARGQIRRIGSPALDQTVVGPALLATARPGWEQADRSFRDALHHRRGGPDERGAAITDAHAALEAALKAAGLKGDTLANLAKSLRNSDLVLPQLEGVPEMLDRLLKRSQSVRDSLSDAHGRDPGAAAVPAEVVDLAIHWTGAFIVYLADATAP
jgi:hypothetical protein